MTASFIITMSITLCMSFSFRSSYATTFIMASSRIVSIVLLVLAVFLPLCASLEKGSIYNLRNVADESYLRVESGGALCKYMGPVVTSSTLNSTSAAFRWRYAELTSDLKWLDIESNGDMLQDNELTMEPIAPYCYPTFRNLNFIKFWNNQYRVQNTRDETCLLSTGVGNRISWGNCDDYNQSQLWYFIEA